MSAPVERYPRERRDVLYSYGWVDEKAGTVHIPIERAMDLIVQRGLPVRGSGSVAMTQPQRPPNKARRNRGRLKLPKGRRRNDLQERDSDFRRDFSVSVRCAVCGVRFGADEQRRDAPPANTTSAALENVGIEQRLDAQVRPMLISVRDRQDRKARDYFAASDDPQPGLLTTAPCCAARPLLDSPARCVW